MRRFHDANLSGLWYLLVFVPFGSLAVLIMTLLPGKSEGVRFDYPAGAQPAGAVPQQAGGELSSPAALTRIADQNER